VTRHRQVHVVVIERMGDRAVDERRRQHRQAGRMADDPGLRGTASLDELVEKDADQLVTGAGEAHADIIEHTLAGELAHLLGQRVVGDRASLLGQSAGEAHAAADRCTVHLFLLSVP
jgi:hypothetical protein